MKIKGVVVNIEDIVVQIDIYFYVFLYILNVVDDWY